jgi:hypothetical protein
MSAERKCFAHVILFQCPQCSGPLSSAFLSCNETLESLDGGQFRAICRCGWMGDGLDLSSLNHSVQAWNNSSKPSLSSAAALRQGLSTSGEFPHACPDEWLFRVSKKIAAFSASRVQVQGEATTR